MLLACPLFGTKQPIHEQQTVVGGAVDSRYLDTYIVSELLDVHHKTVHYCHFCTTNWPTVDEVMRGDMKRTAQLLAVTMEFILQQLSTLLQRNPSWQRERFQFLHWQCGCKTALAFWITDSQLLHWMTSAHSIALPAQTSNHLLNGITLHILHKDLCRGILGNIRKWSN